ncbi:hypothetical protein Tco_1475155 [Tanacetum coccineum]
METPDMLGVPRYLVEHRLNIREGCPPVRQKKRGQAPDRSKPINEEVSKLVKAGILTEVFSIWKAFGGNTRDLGSFGEETDKTTDLDQHLLRLCSQRLETASQDTRDAVTIHHTTVSQHLTTASARMTQLKI